MVVAVVVVVIVCQLQGWRERDNTRTGRRGGLLSVGSLWGGETGGTGRGWRSVLAVRTGARGGTAGGRLVVEAAVDELHVRGAVSNGRGACGGASLRGALYGGL